MNSRRFCPYCMNPVEEGQPCKICGLTEGSYTPQPHHLPPGTVLRDRYLIGRVLGEGGFGITYIGCDLQLEIRVAIKEYYPNSKVSRIAAYSLEVSRQAGTKPEEVERDLDRFLREARTMAKLVKQPNIVTVTNFFRDNGTAYIVMEYIDGTTFKELAQQRGGRIPAWELLQRIEPLFYALQTMHEAGLIHRDISPDNIMLEDGMVRLLDFGCTRELNGKTMTVQVKLSYAPYEQYTGKNQGPWTDVYSLACTIYYCLTGKTPPQAYDRIYAQNAEERRADFPGRESPQAGGPFDAAFQADEEDWIEAGRLIPPRALGVDLTASQEAALLRAMNIYPEDRWQSMMEFHAALYEGVVAEPAAPDDGRDKSEEPSPDRTKEELLNDANHESAEGTGKEEVSSSDSMEEEPSDDADRTSAAGIRKMPGQSLRNAADTVFTWIRRSPLIAGAGAAAVLVILIAVILLSAGSGGSTTDETGGSGEEIIASEISGEEAEEEAGETEEEAEEDITAEPYYELLDGVAYVKDAQEVSLRDALLNDEVESVVVRYNTISIEDGTLYVNKPLTLEAGLYTNCSVIVGEGGCLTVDIQNENGDLCVNGLLRTMGGGTITVTSTGVVSSEGYAVLWLESWEDLTLQEGAQFSFSGEELTVGENTDVYYALNEGEVFKDAQEVSNQDDLIEAMADPEVSSIEITANITLTQAFAQTKPVRIAEGVTVTALGEDQDPVTDEDGTVIGITHTSGENRPSPWNWTVYGTVLVNHGTLLGDLYANAEDGDGVSAWAGIINEGTIDISGQLNYGSTVVNQEGAVFNFMHGHCECSYINLGTLTHIPRLGDGLNELEVGSRAIINCGTIRIEGTDEVVSRLRLRCGELFNGTTGVIEIGENGSLVNDCELRSLGTVTLTADSASFLNQALLTLYGGTVDVSAGTWENSGILQTDDPELLVGADGAEGTVTVLPWSSDEDVLWVSNAAGLKSALNSGWYQVIGLSETIVWEGDLTISGGIQIIGEALTLSGGDLTVTGSGSVVSAALDLGGGTLTVTDSAVVILRSDGQEEEDGTNSNLRNCSSLVVTGNGFVFVNGALVLEDAGIYLAEASDSDISGACSRLVGQYDIELNNCEVYIEQKGELTVYGSFYADGDTQIFNYGAITLDGSEEITGTIEGGGSVDGMDE